MVPRPSLPRHPCFPAGSGQAGEKTQRRGRPVRRSGLRRSCLLRAPEDQDPSPRPHGRGGHPFHRLLFIGSSMLALACRSADRTQSQPGRGIRLDSRWSGGAYAGLRGDHPPAFEKSRLRNLHVGQVALQREVQFTPAASAGRRRLRSLVRDPEQCQSVP